MKRTILPLLAAVLIASCGGGNTNQSAQNADNQTTTTTVNTDGKPLVVQIAAQLPDKFLPEGATKNDVIAGLDYDDKHASYNIDGEDCNTDLQMHLFKRADGSYLVLYATYAGCNCNVMLSCQAFNYSNGKLTETQWPVPNPKFDDFYDPVVLFGQPSAAIETTKKEGVAEFCFYTDEDAEGDYLTAYWSECEPADFAVQRRLITYEWNGNNFGEKTHSPYFAIVPGVGLGGIKLGGDCPSALDGFTTSKTNGGSTRFSDAASGEAVFEVKCDARGKVTDIAVLSPRYAISVEGDAQFLAPDCLIDAVLNADPNSKVYKDGGTAMIINSFGSFLCEGDDFEGDDGELQLIQCNPQGTVKAVCILSEEK